ncbi:MAG TPA: UDP-N-acetylmuramoyl-tripeptide--D-alanyl-D-alanine ligase [Chitinophagales bacterium]|nr:UDP-N-acetylmuramoyl-tripeptide--D-alanyl-D-alanine ligase [Chitinophagales bacterium]
MEINQLYKLFKQSTGVTTDTRNIKQNQLFFALKGDSFNGNTFAEKALEIGASYSIIDEKEFQQNKKCILVSDVLQTLQQLANYHLHQINPKHILAITGSNGKTTTKELVNAVLSTAYKTHYTKGNLNNHIGIPLTILEMQENTEIAIIEMGANHQKEIESYCHYVEPTHGIITNCGKAHLEGFGGIEGIQKGKGELYDYIKTHNGKVLVNGDDSILLNMLTQRNMSNYVSYGNKLTNNFHSTILIEQPFLKIQFEDVEINSNLYGSYNYSNIMCAVAVGKYFGVDNKDIKKAISTYFPNNKRSEILDKGNYKIICDYYNANPTSMQHALESFAKSSSKQKIVILGDMFELGVDAPKEHQFIADLCTHLNFNTIVLVGKEFNNTITSETVIKFITTDEVKIWFQKQQITNAEILLKGSRGMKMEKVIE